MRGLPETTVEQLREELLHEPVLELWRVHINADHPTEPEHILRIVRHDEPVRFEGEVFHPYAVGREAYQEDTAGSLPEVRLAIGNETRLLAQYIDEVHGQREIRVELIAVLKSQLTIPGAAVTVRFVVSKIAVNDRVVGLTLESYFRRQVQIPQRTLRTGRCVHAFGDDLCGYNRQAVGAGYQTCGRTPHECDLRGQDEGRRGIHFRHPERGGFFPALRKVR